MKKTLNRVFAVFIMIEVIIVLCFYYRPVDPFPTAYREMHMYNQDKLIGEFTITKEDKLFANSQNINFGYYVDNYTEFYKMNSSFTLDEKTDFLSIRILNTDKFLVKLRLPYERIEKYDYYIDEGFLYSINSVLFLDGKQYKNNERLYYSLKPAQYSDSKPINEGIEIDKRTKTKDIVNKLFIDFTIYYDASILYPTNDIDRKFACLSIEEISKDNQSLYGKLSTYFEIGGH